MDWWASMNSSNTGPSSSSSSLADQIDTNASMFDPWLNCDDLDLGTILHQAGANHHVSSTNTALTQTVTATIANSTTTAASTACASSLLAPLINQSGNSNKCNGQHQQQQIQGFSNYSETSYETQIQDDDNNNNNNNNHIDLINSHQQPQMNISTSSSSSSSSNSSPPNKPNVFKFITATSCSSGPSSTLSALALNSPINDRNQHNHLLTKERQSILMTNQNNNTNNHSTTIYCTNSLASSTTSPISSTCELSPLSTPLNGAQSSANYLSSSPSSTSTTCSLLMNDNMYTTCGDIKPHILHTTHNHNNNQQSNQRLLANGYCQINSNDEQVSEFCRGQDNQRQFVVNQHQQHYPSVDSKSNLENLLHSNNDNYPSNGQNNDELDRSHNEANSKSIDGNNNSISIGFQQQQQPQSSSTSTTRSKPSNASKSSKVANDHKSNNSTAPKLRRCRHITDFVLADEEKRLLIKEGYSDFPMSCQTRPLTKAEERILRKIRRKIRNKKSAQCSRQRKKEYVEELERKYAAIIRENEQLKHIISRIQDQQESLTRPFDQSNHNNNNTVQQQCNSSELDETLELDWKDLFPSSVKMAQQQQQQQMQQQHHQSNLYI